MDGNTLKPWSVYVMESDQSWYVGSAWNNTTPEDRYTKHHEGTGRARLLWDAIQSGDVFTQTILESGMGEIHSEALEVEERWIHKYLVDDPRLCLNMNLYPTRLDVGWRWADDERSEKLRAILSEKAKAQMDAQWERKRDETGKELGYFGKMARVRKERGDASCYQCANCSGPAKCWVQVDGTDGMDVNLHFHAMCRPCFALAGGFRQQQIAATTPEQRSDSAKSMWAKRTPEERSAIAKRAWETKRAKGYSGPPVDPATGRFMSGVDAVVDSDSDSSVAGNGN